MRDYPPAHLIHEARCFAAPPGLIAFRAQALQAFPNSRPHSCFATETVALNRLVVAETIEYEAHAYQPSTLRPEDATRPLCTVCRSTHPGEPIDLIQWLGVGARR